jgi:kynurenine 3-monooxygenase
MEKVIVVGAGLVGSLLAIFLKKRGFEVEVFERNPDIREHLQVSGRSINLTLCERGLRALDIVGAGEAVRDLSVPAYGRLVHDVAGNLTFQPYGNRNEAIYSISRSGLNAYLLDLAESGYGLEVQFNEKCVGLDLSSATIEMQNRVSGHISRHKADRIIGADGAFSAIRFHLIKTYGFNYSQQYWEQGYKELTVALGAESGWLSERNALHIWPRRQYMLIGFPNVDGSFTCSLHIPLKGDPSFQSITTEKDLTRFVQASFPDAAERFANLAEEYFTNPPNYMITIKCSPWSHGDRILLIGDAVHAIYPSYGQGANAGFEDCAVLDTLIGEYGDDWHSIFLRFEEARKANTDAIADLCVEHFIELRDDVGNPAFQLRKQIERKLSRLYPDRYKDLYSMITFTCIPYAQAIETDRTQRAIRERLLKLAQKNNGIDNPELDRAMESLMREYPGLAHAAAD